MFVRYKLEKPKINVLKLKCLKFNFVVWKSMTLQLEFDKIKMMKLYFCPFDYVVLISVVFIFLHLNI